MSVCGAEVTVISRPLVVFVYSPSACAFVSRLTLVGVFSLRRRRLFVLWILIEVGVILFIGMVANEVNKRAERSAKFFLAQAFIGVALFFAFQVGGWESALGVSGPILRVCILAKMGIAPFHF